MKRLLIMSGVLFWVFSLNSQTLAPQVVATSGKSFSSPTGQVDFTIAEVVTSTLLNGSNCLTQGFHQPEILFTSIENSENEFTFRLYPNPTKQFVIVESTQETEMQVHVYDAMGNAIQKSNLFTKEITIDLGSLASGHYVMAITNASGKHLFSYTMIKI